MCRLSRNSGASTSWNPKGLSRPVAGKLYLISHIKVTKIITNVLYYFYKFYKIVITG
jgi:hypothetical protein